MISEHDYGTLSLGIGEVLPVTYSDTEPGWDSHTIELYEAAVDLLHGVPCDSTLEDTAIRSIVRAKRPRSAARPTSRQKGSH